MKRVIDNLEDAIKSSRIAQVVRKHYIPYGVSLWRAIL